MASSPTILLVHGAWHGSWCWSTVRRQLDAAGLASATVDLPSTHGGPSGALGGLHDDAAVVRDAVQAVDGPVVVVAHSYGGAPTVEGLAGVEGVQHAVFATAFLLDVGESLQAGVGGAPLDWWEPSADGATYTPIDPAYRFYDDCAPEVADRYVPQLLAQSQTSFTEELRAAAWRSIPTTYVVCERDNAIPLVGQEAMAQRAGAVHRLDSGHSPFFAVPDQLTQIVVDVARG